MSEARFIVDDLIDNVPDLDGYTVREAYERGVNDAIACCEAVSGRTPEKDAAEADYQARLKNEEAR